ncbi:MAG: hypothetical protein ABIO73_07510, partial [Polaromonas sp.]
VNHVFALHRVGVLLVHWFCGCVETLGNMAARFVERLTQAVEKVRPDRKFPRNHAIGGAQRCRKTYRKT